MEDDTIYIFTDLNCAVCSGFRRFLSFFCGGNYDFINIKDHNLEKKFPKLKNKNYQKDFFIQVKNKIYKNEEAIHFLLTHSPRTQYFKSCLSGKIGKWYSFAIYQSGSLLRTNCPLLKKTTACQFQVTSPPSA